MGVDPTRDILACLLHQACFDRWKWAGSQKCLKWIFCDYENCLFAVPQYGLVHHHFGKKSAPVAAVNIIMNMIQGAIFSRPLFQRFVLFLLLFHKTINEFKEQKLNIKILLHDFNFLVIRHPCCRKMLVMPVMTSCFLHNYFRYTEYHEMEPAKRIEAYKICQVKI